MDHVKWGVMTVHHNMKEAKEKILKAYKMREECKELADWERDMAVAHVNFNTGGTMLAQDHIRRVRDQHAGEHRTMGMVDVWESWLHEIMSEMAEIRAMMTVSSNRYG